MQNGSVETAFLTLTDTSILINTQRNFFFFRGIRVNSEPDLTHLTEDFDDTITKSKLNDILSEANDLRINDFLSSSNKCN